MKVRCILYVIILCFSIVTLTSQQAVIEANSPYILANIVYQAIQSYESLQTLYQQYQQMVQQYQQMKQTYESWIEGMQNVDFTNIENLPTMYKYMVGGVEQVSDLYLTTNRNIDSLLNQKVMLFGQQVAVKNIVSQSPDMYRRYEQYIKEQASLPPEKVDTFGVHNIMSMIGFDKTVAALTDLNYLNEYNNQGAIKLSVANEQIMTEVNQRKEKLIQDMGAESSMAKNIANLGLMFSDMIDVMTVIQKTQQAQLQDALSDNMELSAEDKEVMEKLRELLAQYNFEQEHNFLKDTKVPSEIGTQ